MKFHPVILDRNVLVEIARYLENHQETERIQRIKALDEPSNWIFMVMVPIEERQDRPDNFEKNAALVSSFFVNAQTDAAQAIEAAELAYQSEIGFKDNFYERLLAFYLGVKKELAQKRKHEDFLKIEDFIVSQADSNGIPRWHPIVLTALGVLYDNNDANKVLKFARDEDPHNPISDILLIIRVTSFSMYPKWEIMFHNDLKFITFDTGLSNIFAAFDLAILGGNLKSGKNGCPVGKSFFPRVGDGWDRLREKIEA